jgi:hypothetical protein
VASSRPIALVGARALTVAVAATLVLWLSAEPAAAHGAGGIEPSNYETVVQGIRPAVPGVEVRSVDVGTKLELRNTSDTDVVVHGYDDEPYLRVGPRGVFENARSPAVFLNREQTPSDDVPPLFDAEARPVWHRIGGGDVVRWHDHRAHWMAEGDPPAVARDPDSTHVVLANWTVPITAGTTSAEIRGDTVYVPATGAWLWVGLAAGLAITTVLLGRTRWWPRVLAAALVTVLVTEAVHVAGSWDATTGSVLAELGAGVYSIAGLVIGAVALIWLLQRDPRDATPLVLVAGLFLFIAGGLADITNLTRSQLPTTLPTGLARLTVAAALGLGLGLMVIAALRLRPPATRSEPRGSEPEAIGAAT